MLVRAVFFLFSVLALFAQATDPRVRDVAYNTLVSVRPAFRLLTRDGFTGSSTGRGGTRGALYYVNDTDSYDALLATFAPSAPASPARVVIAIETSFFTAAVARALAATVPTDLLAGVLVLPSAPPTDGFSPAEQIPNSVLDIHLASGYQWNVNGTALSLDTFTFPLVSVTGTNAATVRRIALENAAFRRAGEHPGYSAHIRQYMFSTESSTHCLDVNNCYPVGGYSVWGCYGNLTAAPARETVMAVAQLDATAFFPGRANGADAAASGVAVLLGAAHALSMAANVTSAERNIVFALFDGEKFDYVGSRRFFGDIYGGFKCPADFVRNGTDPSGNDNVEVGCLKPYRIDTAFRFIDPTSIVSAVEVNQAALSSFLYAHIEKNSTTAPALVTQIKDTASTTPLPYPPPGHTEVRDAAAATPGLPPSSLQSLVNARRWAAVPASMAADPVDDIEKWRDVPAAVLTDHEGQYVNKFYSSRLDNIDNIDHDEGFNQLCASSTLLARQLYRQAFPLTPPTVAQLEEINADCATVVQLVRCLTVNFGCALFHSVAPGAFGANVRAAAASAELTGGATASNLYAQSPPSVYSSVYMPRGNSQVTGVRQALYKYLDAVVRNATKAALGPKPSDEATALLAKQRFSFYHDALDVGLELDLDANKFVVVPNPNTDAAWGFTNAIPWPRSRIWAESNWDTDVGVTLYQTESQSVIVMTAIGGAIVALVSIIASVAIDRCATKLYKET